LSGATPDAIKNKNDQKNEKSSPETPDTPETPEPPVTLGVASDDLVGRLP
jgi:hypothetical protein